MSHRKQIIDAAARAAYVSSWANWAEENGVRLSSGGDLMDQAPRTPASAKAWAKKLIICMEKLNGKKIDAMYEHAAELAFEHHQNNRAVNADNFGHYTAMQALGHGVSWDDSHPSHGFKIPSAEFYCDSPKSCHGYVSERGGRTG